MTCESPAPLGDRAHTRSLDDRQIASTSSSFYRPAPRWRAFDRWAARRDAADLAWFGKDLTRAWARFRSAEANVIAKPFQPDPASAGILDRKLTPEARSAFGRLHRRMAQLADQGRRTPCELAPATYYSEDPADLLEATRACDWCPVRRECGDYADRAGEKHLVWGGVVRDRAKARLVEKLREAEVTA